MQQFTLSNNKTHSKINSQVIESGREELREQQSRMHTHIIHYQNNILVIASNKYENRNN